MCIKYSFIHKIFFIHTSKGDQPVWIKIIKSNYNQYGNQYIVDFYSTLNNHYKDFNLVILLLANCISMKVRMKLTKC